MMLWIHLLDTLFIELQAKSVPQVLAASGCVEA